MLLTAAARAWLPLKAAISRAIAFACPRAPLPSFDSPDVLARHMRAHLVYRADPLNGAMDYYTHPEHVQWQLEGGVSQLARDCDDFACYAYLALSRMPGVQPRIVTLVDQGLKMSHVICAFRDAEGCWGVVDTNGLAWFGHIEPQDEDPLMVARWGRIYACSYVAAITTDYPFSR